jgi:uncharacterized membrane protein YfcA
MLVILSIFSGAIVGFTLGLIGGGGSIIAMPLMLYVVGLEPHMAIGTSAIAVSVNAFVNFVSHVHKGNVRWNSAIIFALFGALGAVIGSSFGKNFDGQKLLFLFAILMIVVGVLMLRKKPDSANAAQPTAERLKLKTMGKEGVTALVVGALSGFFGIGGGFLIVPGLVFSTGMAMIQAIGSSLFSVGTFGLTTAVNYALSGKVDWPVAIEFIVGGALGGIAGARLAGVLSQRKAMLTHIFAGFIFVVALYMLYKTDLALKLWIP